MFEECRALKEVTLSNNVTRIGDYAFSWCYRLKEITIPDRVEQITDNAFNGCRNLTSVTASCRWKKSIESGNFCGAKNITVVNYRHKGGIATCVEKATCYVCGEKYGEFDATNHTGETEVKNVAEATCTENGYTGDTCCKDCGAVLEQGKVIEAKCHVYTSAVTKEPTVTETGVLTYTCANCGDTYTEVIEKLPNPAQGVVAEVTYATHWGNGGQIEILLENTGAALIDGWGTELTINLIGKMTGTWGDGFVTSYENSHIVIKNQDWVKGFETGTKKSVWLQFDGILPVEASNVVIK